MKIASNLQSVTLIFALVLRNVVGPLKRPEMLQEWNVHKATNASRAFAFSLPQVVLANAISMQEVVDHACMVMNVNQDFVKIQQIAVQIQAVTCCILVLHVKRAINVLLLAAWTALLEVARQAVKCAPDLLLIKAVWLVTNARAIIAIRLLTYVSNLLVEAIITCVLVLLVNLTLNALLENACQACATSSILIKAHVCLIMNAIATFVTTLKFARIKTIRPLVTAVSATHLWVRIWSHSYIMS